MAEKPLCITVILLAAGGSTRMGQRDKLLENINETPLLTRVEAACQASKAKEVIAVLRPNDPARRAALCATTKSVTNPDWQHGMASSLQTGLTGASPDCDAVLIVLADMPDVTAQDMNALIAAYRPEQGITLARATNAAGIAGHPVLIGKAHFDELAVLQGDIGARALFKAHKHATALVPTPGDNALTDLDTPADWATYRARP